MNRYSPSLVSSPLVSFLNDPFLGMDFPRFAGLTPRRAAAGYDRLAADFYENEDNYFARLELPGVKKEDVRISLEKDVLSVAWERNREEEDAREAASWRRSIRVPEGINAGAIAARLEDGILTVTLPKAEEVKPREITVQ